MESYEQQVMRELKAWEAKIMRPPSLFNRYAKRLQKKVNQYIPDLALSSGLTSTTIFSTGSEKRR